MLQGCAAGFGPPQPVQGDGQESQVGRLAVAVELVRSRQGGYGFLILLRAVLGVAQHVEKITVVRPKPAGGLAQSQGAIVLRGSAGGLDDVPARVVQGVGIFRPTGGRRGPRCPRKVATSRSLSVSQSRTVPSSPAEASRLPSGLKATPWTGPVCPWYLRITAPVPRSQRTAWPVSAPRRCGDRRS